ncbi:carbon-nitrogen hydrolase family protein [Ferrovum myxofaciens]|uniref:hypothetical protein n=1 Tax=Ferrovum myxofaciens TaxID=416213 RepID=UPI0004E0BB01|nr:hypothetical protein [Ferrovum myxofaciens]
MRIKQLLLPSLLLAGGAIWNVWPAGAAVLSLLLPAGIIQAERKSARWLLAFIWFLAGSVSIVPAAAGFFGSQALGFGVAAWITSSALLALPWVIASTPARAVAAVLLDAIPPIGLIGWLSPLTAAGWLFPGQGLAGVLGCLMVMAWIATVANQRADTRHYRAYVTGGVLAVWSVFANLIYVPPAAPAGWVGIQTSIPPSNGNVFQEISNNRALIAAAQSQGAHAKYLVFPEAVLDDWWPGTRSQFASAVPRGQTWILGAETQTVGARWDALVIARAYHTKANPVFRAALPMPVSMWRPGFSKSFAAVWLEPVQEIGGHRVWANICFDQVLPWIWIAGIIQHPDFVLLPSNTWWAQHWNPAPDIQKTEAMAWIRLMDVPAIWTENASVLNQYPNFFGENIGFPLHLVRR